MPATFPPKVIANHADCWLSCPPWRPNWPFIGVIPVKLSGIPAYCRPLRAAGGRRVRCFSGPILTLEYQALGESAHQIKGWWIESDGSFRQILSTGDDVSLNKNAVVLDKPDVTRLDERLVKKVMSGCDSVLWGIC